MNESRFVHVLLLRVRLGSRHVTMVTDGVQLFHTYLLSPVQALVGESGASASDVGPESSLGAGLCCDCPPDPDGGIWVCDGEAPVRLWSRSVFTPPGVCNAPPTSG